MKKRMKYIAKLYGEGKITFEKADATMQSYYGQMKHCAAHGLRRWIEKNITIEREVKSNECSINNPDDN